MTAKSISVGLEFKSTSFSAAAKISGINVAENKVDILLTPSDGNSWEEKGWNLDELKANFRSGKYKEVERNDVNISIF